LNKSDILKTSHIFCEKCNFYTQAPLCNWIKLNPELFETEVYFFFRLFLFIKNKSIMIENDLTFYSINKFYIKEKLDGDQTFDEKLKLLNTVIEYYNYLI